ncbi:MAG TPA: hypothetical protein VF815_16075 [Myxococcaceae bacterium]
MNIGKNGKLETFELWQPEEPANRSASAQEEADEELLKSSSA